MSDQTPAVPSSASLELPAKLELFDDVERVMRLPLSEIRALSIELVHAGGAVLRKIKFAAGVLAMAARSRMSEKDYGDWAHDYSALLGIHPRTLKRWREDAEHARGTTSSHSRKSTSGARKDILSTAPQISQQDSPPAGSRGPSDEGEAVPPAPLVAGRAQDLGRQAPLVPPLDAPPTGPSAAPYSGRGQSDGEDAPSSSPAAPNLTCGEVHPRQDVYHPGGHPAPTGAPSPSVPAPECGPKGTSAVKGPELAGPPSMADYEKALSLICACPDVYAVNANQMLVAKARQKLGENALNTEALVERQKARMVEPGYRETLIKPPREFNGPIPKVTTKGGK